MQVFLPLRRPMHANDSMEAGVDDAYKYRCVDGMISANENSAKVK